jgi:putative hemolysin
LGKPGPVPVAGVSIARLSPDLFMDDAYLGYRIVALIFVIALNGFFAASEVALLSVRPSRLREMVADGVVGAHAALRLRQEPRLLLSVVQVGVTVASLAAGWAGEATVYRLLESLAAPLLVTPLAVTIARVLSFVLSFVVLTYVMVVIGEVVPKNIALQNADRVSVMVAPILLMVSRVTRPFVHALERGSSLVSRLLNVHEEQPGSHSVEELKVILESSRQSGRISAFQERMISRVLDWENLLVREIMVPRNDIVSVPVDADVDQLLRTLITHKYSRVPVYDQRPESIIGVLLYKDLLRAWESMRLAQQAGHSVPPFRLRALLRKPLVVPETKLIGQMMQEFQQTRSHMALVVDEFGTICGLVTVEDVLEQITGEIDDEFDPDIPEPDLTTHLELDGATNIRDLETQYGIEIPVDAGFETLAGFMLSKLGYLPRAGETVEDQGWRFTVLAMDRRRIARVRIERLPQPDEPAPEPQPEPEPSSSTPAS